LREIHAHSKRLFRKKSASAITLDYLGLPWIALDYLGLPWITLDYLGLPWITLDSAESGLAVFRFQVSGFRFQVSGFRFQVSAFLESHPPPLP
jgi:hypothetical protein